MSLPVKLCLLAGSAALGLWLWEAPPAQQVTDLAVQQFQNSAVVAEQLRQADSAKNRLLLAWPGAVALLAAVLFWDDLETLWKHDPDEA
jgi:hypothetical protein